MPKRRAPVRRKRRYNLRLIKATWPYTVQDVAALLGVNKNAVGLWMRTGLQADRQQRPFLIRGDELVRFLDARQRKRRTKCGLAQFFCFKCRAARDAAGGQASVQTLSPGRFMVQAVCDHCGTRMNKIPGARKLQQMRSHLTITRQEGEHIIECSKPSVNGDLETQS